MSRRAAIAVLVVACAASATVARAADQGLGRAYIADLEAQRQNGELLVSFRLAEAFPSELEERLHSGIPVSFRHRVDMLLKRGFVLTPNKLLERTVVETQVEYDELTRQYRLYRRTENKSKREDDPFLDLEVRRSTESLQEAVRWLTVLEDVPMPWRPEFKPSERLRLRVSSNLGRKFLLLVIPSSYSVTAELRLEF